LELNPQLLDDILTVLKDHGVTEFSCPAFALRLNGAVEPSHEDSEVAQAIHRRKEVELTRKVQLGHYAHASLWPDGEPPSFKGKAPVDSPYKDI
jgi:hypothetical protein